MGKKSKLTNSCFILFLLIGSMVVGIIFLNFYEYNHNNLLNDEIKGKIEFYEDIDIDKPLSSEIIQDWWNPCYKFRRCIILTNQGSQGLSKDYSLKLTINTKELISSGKMRPDGNDLRIVWFNPFIEEWNEIDRVNETNFNTESTEIWFRTQLFMLDFIDYKDYYIYYGNPNADNPPSNKNNVYYYFDDFSQGDGPAEGWEVTQGTGWSVINNEYKEAEDEIDRRAILSSYSVQNASIEVQIKHSDGNGFGGGIMYRYTDSTHYYTIGLGFYDYKIGLGSQNGNDYPEYLYGKDTESDLTIDRWYNLKVEALGSQYKFFIDNKIQFERYSLTDPHSESGKIGLMTWTTTSDVYFDNFKIKLLILNEPILEIDREEQYYKPTINDYKFFKEIRIDHTKIYGSNELINFPLMISLFDSDLHEFTQSDGDDIAFFIGSELLDYEIELYNPNYNSTHTQLIAWIRLPSLSPSSDTIVKMCYGNSSITSIEYPEGVWDSSFAGVWHLNNNPSDLSPQIKDSTLNHNDGTTYGEMSDEVLISAPIGYGLDFEGSNSYQYVECGNDESLSFTESFTIEFWINIDDLAPSDTWPNIIGKGNENNNGWRIYQNESNKRIEFAYRDSTNSNSYWILDSGTSIQLDKWHHLVIKYDLLGNIANMYLDGYKISNSNTVFKIENNLDNLYIADYSHDGEFDGSLDEIRISNVARSEDWILTGYYNQFSPQNFYSISEASNQELRSIFIDDEAPYDLGSLTWQQASNEWWCSGTGTQEEPFIIENIVINGYRNNDCLKIKDSNSHYFIIRNCEFFNGTNGIVLSNSSKGTIYNNTCNENSNTYTAFGIYLFNSHHNSIYLNNVSKNDAIFAGAGIFLENSNNNNISENYGEKNKHAGIGLVDSNYNLLINNLMKKNENHGIILIGSNESLIKDNFIIENLKYGLCISESSKNDIINNEISNNSLIGICIDDSSFSNLLYSNTLNKNNLNAQDNGTENWWNYNEIGNYWSDYQGQDEDTDGIGDIPYNISGIANSQDNYPQGPLMEDTTPPRYTNWRESADPLELGEPEIISIEVFDPAGMRRVMLYCENIWRYMVNIEDNIWRYDSWTPLDVANYTYTIFIEDNNKNYIYLYGSIEVIDTTPPSFSNLNENPDPLELGNYITITVTIEDASTIKSALIIYSGGAHYMNKIDDLTWQYTNWKPENIGSYSYTIYTRDDYNNANTISGSIDVIDTTPPTLYDLYESMDPLELGNSEIIRIKASDLSGIRQALISINEKNYSMLFDGDDEWEFDTWVPETIGTHYYKILIEDNNENWNYLDNSIEVIDTTPPKIINIIEKTEPLELGEYFQIKVITSDLAGIKQVLIEYGNNNYTVSFKEEDTWEYANWAPESVGSYSYILYIQDNNENWKTYQDSLEIIDTKPPQYSNLVKSADPLILGDSINFSIVVQDLSGVNNVLIELKEKNHTMIFKGNNLWVYNLWTPNSTGVYNYKIYIEDSYYNMNSISGNFSVILSENSENIVSAPSDGGGGGSSNGNSDENSSVLILSVILFIAGGAVVGFIGIKKMRSTKVTNSGQFITKQKIIHHHEDKETLLLKRDQYVKDAKISAKYGDYDHVAKLYQECKIISNKLFKLGLVNEAENAKRFANLESEAFSIDLKSSITFSCINDLLSNFGNEKDIWYYVNPKIYPDTSKFIDGLFLNDNNFLQNRLTILEDGKDLLKELSIDFENIGSINAILFKFTNNISSDNFSNIVENYRTLNTILFIVCLKWPKYEYSRILKLDQKNSVNSHNNIFIINHELFAELICLEYDYLKKFNNIIQLNNQMDLTSLESLHKSNLAVLHESDDLKDDLIEKNLISEDPSEFLKFFNWSDNLNED